MLKKNNNSVLKIYLSNTDKLGAQLMYEHLVYLAKDIGLSGVTVYKGIMGFGSSTNQISSSKFWEITDKLPVIIEIIDRTEILENFVKTIEPILEKMPKGCLVTMEPIQILIQKSGKK